MKDIDPAQDPYLSEHADALEAARRILGDGADCETPEEQAEYRDTLNILADGILDSTRAIQDDPLEQDPENPIVRARRTQEVVDKILNPKPEDE